MKAIITLTGKAGEEPVVIESPEVDLAIKVGPLLIMVVENHGLLYVAAKRHDGQRQIIGEFDV